MDKKSRPASLLKRAGAMRRTITPGSPIHDRHARTPGQLSSGDLRTGTRAHDHRQADRHERRLGEADNGVKPGVAAAVHAIFAGYVDDAHTRHPATRGLLPRPRPDGHDAVVWDTGRARR